MNCPKCDIELNEMDFSEGVTLDFCGSCKGLWFDAGEVESLTQVPEKCLVQMFRLDRNGLSIYSERGNCSCHIRCSHLPRLDQSKLGFDHGAQPIMLPLRRAHEGANASLSRVGRKIRVDCPIYSLASDADRQ